jgi:hypothetical protein
MVNKFANTKQTDNNKKRQICKHAKTFVYTAVFDANIPDRLFYHIRKKGNTCSSDKFLIFNIEL